VERTVDIAVVGAGAAGLMAAIWAGRSASLSTRRAEAGVAGHSGRRADNGKGSPEPRRTGRPTVLLLDSARTLGAKILVAGGGRCNVTHDEVDETAYAGSSRNAIRRVLRRFDVPATVAFFGSIGVELKREETGKLFPVTDRARTVLEALLGAARDAGAALVHPWRVETVERAGDGFIVRRATGSAAGSGPAAEQAHAPASSREATAFHARRVVLATGGRSLPKTGSDGHGYAIARSLGHTVTPTFPALVPLTLPPDHFLCGLSGIAIVATVELRSVTGRRLISFTNSTLFTHFGLSGPGILDISRFFLCPSGHREGPGAEAPDLRPRLFLNCMPGESTISLDTRLQSLAHATPLRFLSQRLPERLARALCQQAGVDPATPGHQLTREKRRALAAAVTDLPLPVTGSRGFTHAEVTAGGVPLSEVRLDTLESRVCPGLHLCGEILDVDGRIGGYNFQWAWASGYVAGTGAAAALVQAPSPTPASPELQ
jgi:predicted flavoprotein YhiN